MKLTFTMKLVLGILFFFICFGNAGAQITQKGKALVTPKLDSLLSLIDRDIKEERFKLVIPVIDSLKKTKTYKRKKFDQLAVDLRYAQILYERKEDEKVIDLLLNGLIQLENFPNSKLIGSYYRRLDFFHRKNHNYDKASFYNYKRLTNAISRKDTLSILGSYFDRGIIFSGISELFSENDVRYKDALDSFMFNNKRVTNFPLNTSTERVVAKAYSNLSLLEGKLGNYIESTKYIKKSIEINKKLADSLGLAISMVNLGNVFYRQEQYQKAIDEYMKSVDLIRNSSRIKAIEIQEASSQNISWSYSELEKFKLAYEWQEKATELYDSLSVINKTRDIAAIEAKYLESQKTEIEKNKRLKTQLYFLGFALLTIIVGIIGYAIYNRLLNKQRKTERKISGLKYKALNAQMSPHFINNLLLCIHDLIDTNEKEVAIENLDKFNRLTNLVLRSTKSNLISLSSEIEMLELYMDLQLLRFDNKFEYVIKTNDIQKNDLDGIQIPPLILQPLVENSIVHGFKNLKRKGKLMINFRLEDDDFLICTIADNGIETPEDLMPEMYTKNGISLKNIHERLELISQEKTDKELIALTNVKNESNETIGHKTSLKIPLIYN